MALIKCKECGKEISDTADRCIHCGYPLHGENKTGKKVSNVYMWLLAILPLLSIFLLWIIWYLLDSYFIGMFIMIVFFCVFSIILINLDYKSLKNSGVDLTSLGKVSFFRIVIPKYIYKRATMLKQNLSYFVVWLICVIFYCIVIVVGFNPLSLLNTSVKQIQSSTLYICPDYTVNELINSSIENPKWKSKTTFDGESIVTVSGKIDYDGEKRDVVIEYTIKGDEFGITDIKIEGESLDKDAYYEVIDYICNINNYTDDEVETDETENDTLIDATKIDWKINYSQKDYKYSNLSKLTYGQYMDLYNSNKPFVVIFTQSNCGYCEQYIPVINEYVSRNNIPVYFLEINTMDMDDFNDILSSLSYFDDNDSWGTPLTLAIKNKMAINDISGFTDNQSTINTFFKSIYG